MRHSKDSNNLSAVARNNKIVILAHLIDVLVMSTFCVLQAVSGLQPWSYALIILFLALTPVIVERSLFKKDNESHAIKYIAAVGFLIFYTYTMFTSTNQLVFVFVVPMILIFSVYNDVRYSLIVNLIAIAESFIIGALGIYTGNFGYLGIDYGIIQVVFMILVGIYSLFTAKTLNANFGQVFRDLSSVSNEMKSGIQDINSELVKLNEASNATITAMQEVSTGTTDTADAVQSQLIQTQEIHSIVGLVSDSTSQITDHMKQTLAVLEQGNENVSLLVEKVDVSVQNGEDVAEKLRILEKSITEMNSIVDMISDVARQTGLLSLNARIEASHAGHFGKGFAVVADEISAMADQTKEATTHISDMIESIASGIKEVVTVIYQMIDGIQEEKESTSCTADSFASIQSSTLSIRDNLDVLIGHIHDLTDANRLIADSVQTISAVSEEVSAHAAETTSAEEENAAILKRIDNRMHELINKIER